MSFLNCDQTNQIFFIDLMVPTKNDALDFVLRSFLDFVNQENLIGVALKTSIHFDVEVAFLLKVINQILLTLAYQITIDHSFRVDGDEHLHLPARHEWQK